MFWSFLTINRPSYRNTRYISVVHVVWDPIILTVILKYIYDIKNCITLSSFGCVEIYIGNKS